MTSNEEFPNQSKYHCLGRHELPRAEATSPLVLVISKKPLNASIFAACSTRSGRANVSFAPGAAHRHGLLLNRLFGFSY